jgi:SAM-dependent methyltransferase
MNRNITNSIRFVLDELMPPILRDNRLLMYPLFYIWYKGKNVQKLMHFKDRVHELTPEEFTHYYDIYDSLPKRETDLSEASIEYIYHKLEGFKDASIIDVGCGSGYLLKRLSRDGFNHLTGCDLNPPDLGEKIKTNKVYLEQLPYRDQEFDVVICNHVLEHVLDVEKTVHELKRITKKRLIITLPRQRYNRYTFELHINFFPQKSYLLRTLRWDGPHECELLGGDWSFSGDVQALLS